MKALRSRELRHTRPIHPSKAPKHDHPEPIRPQPPTENGGVAGPIQTTAGQQYSAPSPVGTGFDGVGNGTAGYVPSSNPPDVNGRVGATQFVQWNNSSFAIFDKVTGALQYGPAAGNTLFQALGGVCASHNDGDPVVSYDILAGRWVLSQFVVGGPSGSASHQCVAVSTTSDAMGDYYLYDFMTDGTNFVDYPHTAVWPDGYYMSTHVFNAAGTSYLAGRVYVFERDKMIAGQPARQLQADLAKDGAGVQYGFLPADLDSITPPPAGEAAFILGPNAQFTNRTDSTRVKVNWGTTPTIALTTAVISTTGLSSAPCVNNTSAQNNRDCVPQPSPAVGADYLDNLDSHFMYRLAYRNNGTQAAPQESLLASATVPGSASTPAHGAVKWWEFRNTGSSTTTPTLFQSGTFDPDSGYRFMPSIAMDKDLNIALGYSKSSTSVKPGIYMTGRLGTDAAGTMGAETQVQAGLGVQTSGAGNRWGDYSSMTLDPIDQCTFYYTNEYLKTNGAFNWSTRIATYKFPSCVSAASAYGTVTGTITSSGAPIQGVTVTLSNGYAGSSDANGVYKITVPAGSYTASAADADRNCATASPASASVAPQGGGTVTQNFSMAGGSKLEGNGVSIDDSLGNNNGIVNKSECVKLNVGVKNNGCAAETTISATLSTSTPGVTVLDATASYPNLPIDGSGTNATPFRISTSDTFVCGTDIALSLNLTYASGTKTVALTVPSCAGGANQSIPTSSLTTSDLTQGDRLGRDGVPSTCSGKTSPGGGFAGTKYYKKWTFTNSSGAPRCFTVAINAGLGGAGDIESAAYDQAYDPTNLSLNYLGDSGISGLGTTVGSATYSFTVPAQHNFVVVVNTTGATTSSQFSGTVSGFVDNVAGPGACSGNPTPTPTAAPTPTPTPTATPTPTPIATPTPTPTVTPTPTPTATPTPTPTPTATPTPAPDFALSISPSVATVSAKGGTVTYTVSITRTGGFSAPLTMSVSGLPAGATGSFTPNPANGSSATLTVVVSNSVNRGTYPLTVTATGGSPVVTHTATATLKSK